MPFFLLRCLEEALFIQFINHGPALLPHRSAVSASELLHRAHPSRIHQNGPMYYRVPILIHLIAGSRSSIMNTSKWPHVLPDSNTHTSNCWITLKSNLSSTSLRSAGFGVAASRSSLKNTSKWPNVLPGSNTHTYNCWITLISLKHGVFNASSRSNTLTIQSSLVSGDICRRILARSRTF